MDDEKRVMEIDKTEFAIIVNALMSLRNNLLQQEKETDIVDKVIRKTIKTPVKQKKGVFYKKKRNDVHEER